MRIFLLFLLSALLVGAGEIEDQYWAAARKGDVAALSACLEKGVAVDAKTRHGVTALFFAAGNGHEDAVKLLIDKGADVNVRDTFYKMSAISRAAGQGHAGVVKLMLARGAAGVDDALMGAVSGGKNDVVAAVIETGKPKPESLSTALAMAERQKKTEIAEMLKQAGAKPQPKAEFKIPAEAMPGYAGTYRNPDRGIEFSVSVKGDKLIFTQAGNDLTLAAYDTTRFRLAEMDGIELSFNLENGKAASLTVKQAGQTFNFARVEEKK